MDALFRTAIMKDYAMAHKVNKLLASEDSPDQKYLVIAMKGHQLYGSAVPECVRMANPGVNDAILIAQSSNEIMNVQDDDTQMTKGMEQLYGHAVSDKYPSVADYLFVFDKDGDQSGTY